MWLSSVPLAITALNDKVGELLCVEEREGSISKRSSESEGDKTYAAMLVISECFALSATDASLASIKRLCMSAIAI